ncbi:MAG TPA: hypothetical protein VK484_05770 [Ferruginibacter sp.]|nr:hypothetical protein [Ferruginibacter sp.]
MKTNFLISSVKNNPLLSSAIVAGSVALFYLVRKMRSGKPLPQIPTQHSRHLTKLFSKAKTV